MNVWSRAKDLFRSVFDNASRGTVFVIVILLVFASGFATKCAYGETRIAVTQDVVHAPDNYAVFLEHRPSAHLNLVGGYFAGRFEGERTDSALVALELVSPPTGCLRAGLGPAYLAHTTEVNGTRLNFSLGLECRTSGNVDFVLRHFSNGKWLGIGPEGRPNKGWNFAGVALRF